LRTSLIPSPFLPGGEAICLIDFYYDAQFSVRVGTDHKFFPAHVLACNPYAIGPIKNDLAKYRR